MDKNTYMNKDGSSWMDTGISHRRHRRLIYVNEYAHTSDAPEHDVMLVPKYK